MHCTFAIAGEFAGTECIRPVELRERGQVRRAEPFVHVEGPNGTTEPTQLNYYPGSTGPGGWFECWWENATNNGPAGRYRAIAQLPASSRTASSPSHFVRAYTPEGLGRASSS